MNDLMRMVQNLLPNYFTIKFINYNFISYFKSVKLIDILACDNNIQATLVVVQQF